MAYYESWKAIETEEFSLWFDLLDDAAKEDIVVKIEVLKNIGPTLGRPLVDTVRCSRHSNMKELRVISKGRPFRILFAFDPKRRVVLLAGGNKEGDESFYVRMIPLADRLFDEYLTGLRDVRKNKEKKDGKRKK